MSQSHFDEWAAQSDRPDHGYRDPTLWTRLEPLLWDAIIAARKAIYDVTITDYDTYRDKVGFLRGLMWTVRLAEQLQRREPTRQDDEDA